MNDRLVDQNLDDDHHGVLVDHHKNVMDDLMTDVNLDVSLYLHMNDPLDDLNLDADHHGVLVDHHKNVMDDLMTDVNLDVSLYLHMNDPLDDLNLDADHHGVLVDHHKNVMDDLMTDVNLDVSLYLHMNDPLDDLNLDADHHGVLVDHHKNVMDDLMTDVNLDVSLYLHMNDPLDDLNLDADHHGVLVDHHKNVMDDLMTDVSRVNRNYVRRDLSLDAMTDGSHDHRRSDLLGDHHDRKMDGNLGGNLCLHMSDRVDDHSMDGKKSHRVDLSIDPECYVLVDHHKNVTDDRNDLKMVVNHVSRNYVLPDQKMDAMTDGNLCHRMNDRLVGQNLGVNRDHHTNDLLGDHLMDDDHHDALVGHRKNGMDDLKMDANLVVNRDRRMNGTDDRNDLKTDGKKDAMNRRVMCY